MFEPLHAAFFIIQPPRSGTPGWLFNIESGRLPFRLFAERTKLRGLESRGLPRVCFHGSIDRRHHSATSSGHRGGFFIICLKVPAFVNFSHLERAPGWLIYVEVPAFH